METNRKIQFTKIRDVKSPNRANLNDAGMDFYIPNYSEEFSNDLKAKNKANNLQYILDKNTYLEANNKSGIASKYHLVVGASVVDADYQGEVHINLCNNGNTDITIKCGQKLVQFIHQIYLDTDWSEISTTEYNKIDPSDRGAGMAGSTGIFAKK